MRLRCCLGLQILQISMQSAICGMRWGKKKSNAWWLHLTTGVYRTLRSACKPLGARYHSISSEVFRSLELSAVRAVFFLWQNKGNLHNIRVILLLWQIDVQIRKNGRKYFFATKLMHKYLDFTSCYLNLEICYMVLWYDKTKRKLKTKVVYIQKNLILTLSIVKDL